MKTAIKIDHLVLAQVLGLVGIDRSDPDFGEIVVFLRLRYLHYQRIAVIKGMAQATFDHRIANALVSDLKEQLASTFALTEVEALSVDKQMHSHYHFMTHATPEENAAAKQLIEALPVFDQGVLTLFRDGLSQPQIAQVMNVPLSDVTAVGKEIKTIYSQVNSD